MADTPATQPTEGQAEAQALAEAKAGYEGRARAAAASAAPAPAQPAASDVQQPAAGEPLAETGTSSSAAAPAAPEQREPDPQAEPAKPTPAEAALKQQLEDLKAQVQELKASGADAATVRKMHGEIGDINRTLKQFAAVKAAEAPADDELAAALKSAEAVADEYPDIAGPIVKAIKALQARAPAPAVAPEPAQPDPQQQPEPTQASPSAEEERDEHGYTKEQRRAIAELDELHPDRFEIKASSEYQAWFANWMTPEYRAKVNSSWNPAVVAEPFTAFKVYRASLQRKKDRLDAAATPQGTPQSSTPSTLPDEAGFERGYKRAAQSRHF